MLKTADALKLIEQLQNFVVQRNEIIEDLQNELSNVKKERDDLAESVKSLQRQNLALRKLYCSSSTNMTMESQPALASSIKDNSTKPDPTAAPDRETSSHGESTSYNTVSEERELEQSEPPAKPVIKTPSKKLIHRTSSRDRGRVHRTDSANLYELSTDIAEKAIECLEKKYGGKERANQAARIIQHSYRHWVLGKSFLRVRAYSGRKRSITMPERQFNKLKNKTFVFYGPENPVMIVDGELPIERGEKASAEHKTEDEAECHETKPNIIELAKEEGMRICSQSTVDSDDNDETLIGDDGECDETHQETPCKEDGHYSEGGASEHDETSSLGDERNEERDEVDATKDEKDAVSVKSTISSSSDGSYDIIDDNNVVTVVGKSSVNLQDGSKLTVDKLYDDSPDGMSFSTPRYEPQFDKAMHKRQFRIGVNLFNWKPEVGIQYLIDNGHIGEDVKSIANFLRKETTVSKQKISEYFGNLRNDFNTKVLHEFGKSFDFVKKDVDEALRQFQSYFKLTGEAQTVEKFLQVFSDRYVECNPGRVSDNPDTILLLAFALAMLNTDLHNQNVKRRMSPEDFMKNLRGTDNGNDLDETMLRNMYNRIQKNEFATGADHTTQLHQIESSFVGKVPNLSLPHRQFVKLYTVEEVHEANRKDKQAHNRLAFLFNDLLLLAKPRGKSGSHGAGHVFTCKASYSLLGKKVAEFSNEHYNNGVAIVGRFDNKAVATFNMKDEKTRLSFVEEIDEYIRETNGMENIRLALSKAKQLSWHNNRRKDDGRTKSLLLQVTPTMDGADTTSLTDLRIGIDSAHASDEKIISSVSMGEINEVKSDSEDCDSLQRTNSTSSLDPKSHTMNSNLKASSVNTTHTSHTLSISRGTTVKALFGHWAPKFRKSVTYNDRRRSTSPNIREIAQHEKSPSPPVKRNRTPSVTSEGSSDKRKTAIT